MSQPASFSYVDEDDVARSSDGIMLACPVCGEPEVVAAFDAVMTEETPKTCPLGTKGPWMVVPLMCVSEQCATIFGIVIGTQDLTTVVGYAIPEGV